MQRFVKSLIDSSICKGDKFLGKLNYVSIYLTEFPKSIVWFHYLNALSTVKRNPSILELPLTKVNNPIKVYFDSEEKSRL